MFYYNEDLEKASPTARFWTIVISVVLAGIAIGWSYALKANDHVTALACGACVGTFTVLLVNVFTRTSEYDRSKVFWRLLGAWALEKFALIVCLALGFTYLPALFGPGALTNTIVGGLSLLVMWVVFQLLMAIGWIQLPLNLAAVIVSFIVVALATFLAAVFTVMYINNGSMGEFTMPAAIAVNGVALVVGTLIMPQIAETVEDNQQQTAVRTNTTTRPAYR